MISILQKLTDADVWQEYLQYKTDKGHLSKKELQELSDFIKNKEYLKITNNILDESYCFNPPVKAFINKSGTGKKRIIYTFSHDEAMVLKVMTYLLYHYDHKLNSCCYSFRRNVSAKDAIKKVVATKDLSKMFCLKVDISNYFNSIPADRLVIRLAEIIDDDEPLLNFLSRILLANEAIENGNIIHENRGAMAGTPISPFLANIYLKPLDEYYSSNGTLYFRYSDDILMFFPTIKELHAEYSYLCDYLSKAGLSINPDKLYVSAPGETFEFLGISYDNGIVDLSTTTINKIKAKIRRKARALYRWRIKRGATFEQTAKVMIRVFNKKFFDDIDEHSFTWSRWFFPLINTDVSLKEIDAYLLQYIRYIYKGRHYKGNYKVKYEDIKALGYRSLVNEYYKSTKSL